MKVRPRYAGTDLTGQIHDGEDEVVNSRGGGVCNSLNSSRQWHTGQLVLIGYGNFFVEFNIWKFLLTTVTSIH